MSKPNSRLARNTTTDVNIVNRPEMTPAPEKPFVEVDSLDNLVDVHSLSDGLDTDSREGRVGIYCLARCISDPSTDRSSSRFGRFLYSLAKSGVNLLEESRRELLEVSLGDSNLATNLDVQNGDLGPIRDDFVAA